MSHSREHAASAPIDAPEISLSSRCGAYFLKQQATPTWYIPRKPHPANERFIFTCPLLYIGCRCYCFYHSRIIVSFVFAHRLSNTRLASSVSLYITLIAKSCGFAMVGMRLALLLAIWLVEMWWCGTRSCRYVINVKDSCSDERDFWIIITWWTCLLCLQRWPFCGW